MKKYLFVAAAITIMVASAAPVGAWTVSIKNSCSKRVDITVYGEHLFWRNTPDCTVSVNENSSETCPMPGGICPVTISSFWGDNSGDRDNQSVYCNGGIACCRNITVEIVKYSDGEKTTCKPEMR